MHDILKEPIRILTKELVSSEKDSEKLTIPINSVLMVMKVNPGTEEKKPTVSFCVDDKWSTVYEEDLQVFEESSCPSSTFFGS